MVTLTRRPQNESISAHKTAVVERKAHEAVETSHQIPNIIKELTGKPKPVEKESFPQKLAGSVLAFYDWLSGPPMSERDRIQRDIAEAHPQVHTNSGGV